MNASSAQINVQQEFSEKLTVHKNLGQDVIVITVDKVRLCLIEHRDAVVRRKEWLMPLGLLASLVPTLVAADFKKFLLEPAVWQAIYLLATGACIVWLLITLIRAWQYRKSGSIDELVQTLMARQLDPPRAPDA